MTTTSYSETMGNLRSILIIKTHVLVYQ